MTTRSAKFFRQTSNISGKISTRFRQKPRNSLYGCRCSRANAQNLLKRQQNVRMTSELIDEVFENPSQKITFLSIPLKQSTKNLHDIVEKKRTSLDFCSMQQPLHTRVSGVRNGKNWSRQLSRMRSQATSLHTPLAKKEKAMCQQAQKRNTIPHQSI